MVFEKVFCPQLSMFAYKVKIPTYINLPFIQDFTEFKKEFKGEWYKEGFVWYFENEEEALLFSLKYL